jgi:hypothetical protein
VILFLQKYIPQYPGFVNKSARPRMAAWNWSATLRPRLLDRSLYSNPMSPFGVTPAILTNQNLASTAEVSIAKAETPASNILFPLGRPPGQCRRA